MYLFYGWKRIGGEAELPMTPRPGDMDAVHVVKGHKLEGSTRLIEIIATLLRGLNKAGNLMIEWIAREENWTKNATRKPAR